MEYFLYLGIGVAFLYVLVRRISRKGQELINIFWDGYRIYAVSGNQEARASLLIGLATVSKSHKDALITAISKDNQESALMLKLSQQDLDEETMSKMRLIYPEIDAMRSLDERGVVAIKNIQKDVKEVLEHFSTVEPDIKLSLAIKGKYSKDFPELVTAINRFKHRYFREKYPAMNEPTFLDRQKIWAAAETNQSNNSSKQ